MPRSQKNDNFIDKTFTVVADIILKVLPTSKEEKEAFSYYRDGMCAQSEGEYAEALENYYEALRLEEDPFDRSYILYNIGLIYGSNGEYTKALEYYHKWYEQISKEGINSFWGFTAYNSYGISLIKEGQVEKRKRNVAKTN